MRNFLKLMAMFIAVFVFASCERIDAGHEGIRVNMTGSDKGVDDINLVTGWVFYNPFTTTVHEVPMYVQTIDYEAFTINAKDGTAFTIDPKVNLRPTPNMSPAIFAKYRKPISDVMQYVLQTHIQNAYKNKLNSYTTDELLSKREQFEGETEALVRDALAKENFIVDEMTSGLQLPDVLVQSIDAKNRAVQEASKAENEVRRARAEAEKMVVSAEAERRSYELKTKSLTKEILMQQWIDKWDGKLPVYSSDGGNMPMIIKQ